MNSQPMMCLYTFLESAQKFRRVYLRFFATTFVPFPVTNATHYVILYVSRFLRKGYLKRYTTVTQTGMK